MRISTVFIALLLLLLIGGCSAIISAPETLHQPREVQLLQHGRHSSLLLTAADQSRLRYSFGDWAWYVESDQSLASGSRALFKDSKGALGRQIVAATTAGENLAAKVGVGIGKAYLFQVEATQVDALLATLEQQFTASPSVPFYSAERHLSFVPHSRPYTFSYNSNHQVADWLRTLGLQVQGNPAWGNWRVKETATAKDH